jgi:hypothetical protein
VKGKLSWPIFWAMIVVFIVLVLNILTPDAIFEPAFRRSLFIWVLFAGGAVFFLLGAALIFLILKEKVAGKAKRFLILTGASAVGLPVFAVLHNLVYALFIMWFGEDFWGAGGDEPVFFILAVIVCPIAFLVGVVGTIVLAIKNKRAAPVATS